MSTITPTIPVTVTTETGEDNKTQQKTLLHNIAYKLLHLLSLATIFSIGAALCSQVATSLIALGYMILAMKNVIENEGKVKTALPGQKILSEMVIVATAIVLLSLPGIMTVQAMPLIGLLLLMVALIYTTVGCAAILAGAPKTHIFQLQKSIHHLQQQNPQKHWLYNLVSQYSQACKTTCTTFANMWMLGVKAFLGAYLWLLVPSFFIAIGWYSSWIFSFERLTYEMSFFVTLTLIGMFVLGWVAFYLPMLTAHFCTQGTIRSFFQLKQAQKQIRKVPFFYGFALLFTILLMLFPYGAKVPRLQPENVQGVAFGYFILILWAKLLWAKAYHKAEQGQEKGFFAFSRWWLRIAKVASFILVPFILVLSQFISWRGAYGFFEHFMYLLPTSF